MKDPMASHQSKTTNYGLDLAVKTRCFLLTITYTGRVAAPLRECRQDWHSSTAVGEKLRTVSMGLWNLGTQILQ